MGRAFTEKKLVIASHNQGKVREIRDLVGPLGIEVVSAGELDLPEPEETGTTYIENAELKARAAAEGSGLPCLADDSGLSVTALDGDPGIYSARWAGPGKDFSLAMRKVEDALREKAAAGNPDRSAAFVCALTICWPDGHTESVEGRVHGDLVWPPRGENGFGYDPMFVPEGHDRTFGEVDSDWKHSVSHRAIAFEKLLELVGLDRRSAKAG
ncbi:RdgB/HAM1 family non-canonical purine NTP pyrophosphatase [Nisaea acidiphila]|uniref:dITP/XTP pyrophosphatase n=1 Tax=Nisaea acidiphila TaxID=1862145 RepID=A0A9J7AY04_9PROT|nr:RdgB/HAM1 family non-canonical purine NTP pyrophosphatase [Nisaea acidiphila]UUX52160.1 RdgB/HAM1 family non-canonical purine NTP pyrophosphatase [Nisaea acidiphila]